MIHMRRLLFLAILMLAVGCEIVGEDPGANPDRESSDGADDSAETPGEEATRPLSGNTTILADGQLAAVNPPLPLSFQTGGRVTAVHAAVGDEIMEGDLIATLDDQAIQENIDSAELAVSQAAISLEQAQLALDKLLEWEPDALIVAAAESSLAATEASLESALSQEEVEGSSLTSASISVTQAERALADMQEAYDNAWDEARDWEENYEEPICYQGQGGPVPCTGPTWKDRIKADREGTTRGLQSAKERLTIARANYSLAQAGLGSGLVVGAEASVAGAQQALDQAQKGPIESDITGARLQVSQAELALQQAEFNQGLAENALENIELYSPSNGTVLLVDSMEGAIVGAGMPIITIQDAAALRFHTLNLSERDLAYIGPGQAAEVTLKSYPSQTLSGTVAYVVPQASGILGDAATFTVVIELDPTELELKPGMTGRVDIERNEG